MKTVTELAPLAIGIAVVGGITWWLLDQNASLGRWLAVAGPWSPVGSTIPM